MYFVSKLYIHVPMNMYFQNTAYQYMYLNTPFCFELQVDKKVLCITLILGLTSDEDKIVRSSALRTVGVFVLFPCLKEVS